MNTAAIESSGLSKRHEEKAVAKKEVASNRKREAMPERQYDDFQSAIEDVKAGRISRFNVEMFAVEIKQEIQRGE